MPRLTSDLARVEIGGAKIETWQEYTIDSDILQPADAFQFRATLPSGRGRGAKSSRSDVRSALKAGSDVKVYVGDDITGARRGRYLQLTGIAETCHIAGTHDGGTEITIDGRDLACHLTDSSAPLDLLEASGTTFADVVKAAVEPWGLTVIADSSASRDVRTGKRRWTAEDRAQIREARSAGIPPRMYSRELQRRAESSGQDIGSLSGAGQPSSIDGGAYANDLSQRDIEKLTVKEARPQPGETVWEYLDRHARRLGLLLWFSPNGKIVVSSPRYRQEPLYRLIRRYENRDSDPNTIVSGGVTFDDRSRYSQVTVLGRGPVTGDRRTHIRATEKDDSLPYYKPLIVHDRSVRSQDEATRRAKRELGQYKANAVVLEYEVKDHGQGHWLYAVDTIAYVDDEISGVRGPHYVTKRTFEKSKHRGTTTRIRLVPPGSIVL